jgi:hypothetical protein
VTPAIATFVRLEGGELWSTAFASAPPGWHAVSPRLATGDIHDDRPAVMRIGDSNVMISGRVCGADATTRRTALARRWQIATPRE